MQKGFLFIIASVCASFIPLFAHSALASAPVITTTTLLHEIVDTYHSETPEFTAGMAPFTWSIASGSLPGGIGLNTSDGTMSGTPYAAGTYHFTIQITDDNSDSDTQDLTIIVRPLLVITTGSYSLAEATVGRPYSQYIAVTGGVAPFEWTLTSGTLTGGVSLNSSTGELSGTEVESSPYGTFTITVTDSDGQSVDRQLSILVNPQPTITTTSLTSGAVNTYKVWGLSSIDGTLPFTWSVVSGSFPDGLVLGGASQRNASLSGRPTNVGTSNFVMQIVDANGASTSQSFAITVNYAPPVIANTATDATVNRPYSKTIGLDGGLAPFTWSILSGSLPSGFSIASSTGQISGSPTTISSSSFVVQVVDSYSNLATRSMTLAVRSAPAITTTSLPDGANNSPYSQGISSSGGAGPFAWSVLLGSLPSGLSLSSTTGIISGRTGDAASSSFTIRLTDTNGAIATRSFTLAINHASPTIATTTLSSTIANGSTPYSQTLDVYAGTAPYSWSVVSGSLPYGLSLNSSTGEIYGSTYPYPYSSVGTYHLAFRVDDSNSEFDTQDITLVVYSLPVITTTSLPNGTEGAGYSQTPTVSGGRAPYGWSLVVGPLPNGVSLDSSTGKISGTPTETGNFDIEIRVTDANDQEDTQDLTIVVNPPPTITTIKLDGATAGAGYSKTLAITGGTTPMTWSVASGSLPLGLSLNSSSGVISGTASVSGTSIFIVRALDANVATASQELALIVNPAPVIARNTLPHGKTGKSYSQFFPVAGGTPSFAWTVSAGSLPSGLSLSSTTGILSGTPSGAGTDSFTVQIQDANGATTTKAFTVIVD